MEGRQEMEGTQAIDSQTSVLIVGGGPVGLLTAFQLSRLQIPCIIAEQNLETTIWPKMDLTNCRTMEILRMCGLADEYRQVEGAVGEDSRFDDVYHTGMGPGGKLITTCVSLAMMSFWVRNADARSLYHR
jgi:FAD-dependent monooxygenase